LTVTHRNPFAAKALKSSAQAAEVKPKAMIEKTSTRNCIRSPNLGETEMLLPRKTG
jgi:hypothetical protein